MEDKVKIELEYTIKSSPSILFMRLGTAAGLSEWFADDVVNKKGVFTFTWDDSEEKAMLITKKPDQYARFQWLADEGTDYYFEFKIQIDPITKDLALIITDFVEEDEVEESKMLWDAQVEELMKLLGS